MCMHGESFKIIDNKIYISLYHMLVLDISLRPMDCSIHVQFCPLKIA